MDVLRDNLVWFAMMLLLLGCSAFFSLSEAALFCLRWPDRRALAVGGRAARAAEALLHDPDRLLTTVLFWNLLVNVAYFSIASIVAVRIPSSDPEKWGLQIVLPIVAFLLLVFFGEMLPKSLGMMRPKSLAVLVALPMALVVRVVDPVMPVLRRINLVSRRVIWPGLREEPSLEVADLERALELSRQDRVLVDQEQSVLSRIVSLAEHEVQEWMQPRSQFRAFRPPVTLEDLVEARPAGDYALITESGSDEIAAALSLHDVESLAARNLDLQASRVFYVPWCAGVADTFEQMQRLDNQVAVIVNELGESIGVLTLHDILDSVFADRPHRSDRILRRRTMVATAPGTWQIAGIVNLKRIARELATEFPPSRHVTLGGLIHDLLQRLPEVGDTCVWEGWRFQILRAGSEAELLVEVTREPVPEEEES